jgi:hypothetical protein
MLQDSGELLKKHDASEVVQLALSDSVEDRLDAFMVADSAELAYARVVAGLLVSDTEMLVRERALELLAVVGTADDEFRILTALKDASWVVRSTAISAAASVLGTAATKHIGRMLRDRQPIVRRDAAAALAELNATGWIPEIVRVCGTEKSARAKAGMLYALAYLAEPRYVLDLLALQADDTPALSESIMRFLESLILANRLDPAFRAAIFNAASQIVSVDGSSGAVEPAKRILQHLGSGSGYEPRPSE